MMEFRLDDEQTAMQETVERFCADRFPLDGIVASEGAPLDRSRWAELTGLGVFDLLADGHADTLAAAIVFEQLGSGLVPGPVLWSAIGRGGSEGGLVGGVTADAVVDGVALVAHGAEIDVLLVVGDEAVVAHRTDQLAPPTPLDPLDPLTPVGRFVGLGAGEVVGDATVAARVRLHGQLLVAALLTGVANRSVRVAVDYAQERHQFGAPIGSFQAIKHLVADMHLRSALAQSATYAAAAMVQGNSVEGHSNDEARRAVAGAKVLAGDAAIANASTAIQVLGGMGFTWEMLPNHLLKRAWVLELEFGTADEHAERRGAALVGVS